MPRLTETMWAAHRMQRLGHQMSNHVEYAIYSAARDAYLVFFVTECMRLSHGYYTTKRSYRRHRGLLTRTAGRIFRDVQDQGLQAWLRKRVVPQN